MASVAPPPSTTAVAATSAATSAASSLQLSRNTPTTGSTPAVSSSVILSLGTALQAPLLYTASGLLVSVLSSAPSLLSATSESTPAAPVAPSEEPVAAPVPAPVATPVSAAPVAVATAENTAVASEVVAPLAVTTVVDTDVRALADFLVNPAYGGMATALYMNAASYRGQHLSAAPITAMDLPEPVAAVRAVNVAIADGKSPSPESRRQGTARARA